MNREKNVGSKRPRVDADSPDSERDDGESPRRRRSSTQGKSNDRCVLRYVKRVGKCVLVFLALLIWPTCIFLEEASNHDWKRWLIFDQWSSMGREYAETVLEEPGLVLDGAHVPASLSVATEREFRIAAEDGDASAAAEADEIARERRRFLARVAASEDDLARTGLADGSNP